MTNYEALLMGYHVYIATKEVQRRKHHKKRINKKWRKRYGMIELNSIPHGEVLIIGDTLWMTRRKYLKLRGTDRYRCQYHVLTITALS